MIIRVNFDQFIVSIILKAAGAEIIISRAINPTSIGKFSFPESIKHTLVGYILLWLRKSKPMLFYSKTLNISYPYLYTYIITVVNNGKKYFDI
jgi:hypothetical protein